MSEPSAVDANVGPVLFSAEQIADRVTTLGSEIADHYADSVPIVVGILKGSSVFLSDLIRAIDIPLEVEFLSVSSYGASTRSSGLVRVGRDLDRNISGREVLLVEDIVDTGTTLAYLRNYFAPFEPATIAACSLLLRSSAEVHEQGPSDGEVADGHGLDYVGFKVTSDVFVVGYGLDHDQGYRNLPYIAEFLI